MAKLHKDLADIRNHLYDISERYWLWSLGVSVVIHFTGLLAILVGIPPLVILVGGLTFFGQIIRVFLKERANDLQGKADKCRRLILYSDGLGIDIRPEDYAVAKSWVNLKEVAEAPYIKPYFSSKLPAGPQRLADIVSESTFFTFCQAEKTATYLLRSSILLMLTALLMVYFAVENLLGNSIGVILGKMALIIIGFLFSGDVFILYRRYNRLSQVAHDTFHKLSDFRKNHQVNDYEVMQIVEDYNIKASSTPPLPKFIYLREQDKINKTYRSTFSEDDTNG